MRADGLNDVSARTWEAFMRDENKRRKTPAHVQPNNRHMGPDDEPISLGPISEVVEVDSLMREEKQVRALEKLKNTIPSSKFVKAGTIPPTWDAGTAVSHHFTGPSARDFTADVLEQPCCICADKADVYQQCSCGAKICQLHPTKQPSGCIIAMTEGPFWCPRCIMTSRAERGPERISTVCALRTNDIYTLNTVQYQLRIVYSPRVQDVRVSEPLVIINLANVNYGSIGRQLVEHMEDEYRFRPGNVSALMIRTIAKMNERSSAVGCPLRPSA